MVEEVEDFDMDSIGGLSLLDNLDNMILDFDSSLDMDLLSGTNVEENQNHHLGAVESPGDSRTGSEGPEADATSPEIVWLANRCMSNQSQGPTQVSIEDIIQIILMRFVPHLRGCGFTGASTNELIGNFNASLPGQRPLVPLASNPASTKESPKSPPTLTKTGKWKRKNRPTYATGLKKYNRRKKKNTVRENKTKAQDVSGGGS